MRRGSFSGSTMGMDWIVRRFSVTSSPTRPSPRVAPRTNTPSRYSSATDRPSTFGSTLYSTCSSCSRTFSSKSTTSASEKESCRLSSGTACVTGSNFVSAMPPTRCVGESGVISSGCSFSRFASSRWSISYS